MTYKQIILKLTPDSLHVFVRDVFFFMHAIPNYLYDARRFLFYSGMNKSRRRQSERAARITLFYHQVEKGLSLSEPRLGFGKPIILRLLKDIDDYIASYGIEEPAVTAMAAINTYLDFHREKEFSVDEVEREFINIAEKHETSTKDIAKWQGGTVDISSEQLALAKANGFKSFFESRHSIRQFLGGTIPNHDIRRAVEIAQKTPSVCNRQSWRVHQYSDQDKMAELMKVQAGNRGFGDKASVLLAVTCELGSFVDIGERYQAWIDGGMFSMSICLAIHDAGYGSCCLNWSKTHNVDRAFRKIAGIPESEQVIMLIAVGILPTKLKVARSYRPSVDACLVVH